MHDTAASRDYEEHLGLSVATYFKVQCYNGLPVGAKDCDKSAVELYKLVDSGNSLYNKTAAAEADKAKVKTAFAPECASKLQDIVDNMHDTAASRDYEEHLGLSVATYFKVQCYNGLPVGAKDCDKSAVELYKLVDSGNSL